MAIATPTDKFILLKMFRVMVVGDGYVGKTCLLNRYVFGKPPIDYEPTVFDNHIVEIHIDDKTYEVQLWDTAGQEDYDRLRNLLYAQADCFIVCFAVDNSNSYRHARYKYIPELRKNKPNCPIVLVGTKCDLRQTETVLMKKEFGDILKKYSKAYTYIENSAADDINVKETFEEAVRALIFSKKSKKCYIL